MEDLCGERHLAGAGCLERDTGRWIPSHRYPVRLLRRVEPGRLADPRLRPQVREVRSAHRDLIDATEDVVAVIMRAIGVSMTEPEPDERA